MRITNEADYALRIVYDLLGGSQKSAKLIAEQTGVTLRFALKILRKLAMADIVSARQGASGGYYLKKKPEEISIGLVVETIDGAFEVNNCICEDFECSRVGKEVNACAMHCYFAELNTKIRDDMYAKTFDQFLSN